MKSTYKPEELLQVLNWSPPAQDDSLAFGSAGKCLFMLEYYLCNKRMQSLYLLNSELTKLVNSGNRQPGLFNGLAGKLWILSKFIKASPEASEDRQTEFQMIRDRLCDETAVHLLRPGRYELMNGAVGIGIAALSFGDDQILQLVNSYLQRYQDQHYRFNDTARIYSDDEPLTEIRDLGVSHGLPGIILYCSYYLEVRGEDPLIKKLLLNSGETLLKDILVAGPLIPKFLPGGMPSVHQGWCYGNLSTGLSLLKAGKVLKEKRFSDAGMELIRSALPFFTDFVFTQHHLCHGTGSLLLLLKEIVPFFPANEWDLVISRAQASLGTAAGSEGGLLTGFVGERLARASYFEASLSNWESLFLLKAPV